MLQILLEAQELAIQRYNVEFESNLWVGKYLKATETREVLLHLPPEWIHAAAADFFLLKCSAVKCLKENTLRPVYNNCIP